MPSKRHGPRPAGLRPRILLLCSLFWRRCASPACQRLSFGLVDADLPDSRCRRRRQSVDPANSSLLTACRFRMVERPKAGQPSAEPRAFRTKTNDAFLPSPKKREERRSFRSRMSWLSRKRLVGHRPGPFPSSADERVGSCRATSPPFFCCDVTAPTDKSVFREVFSSL